MDVKLSLEKKGKFGIVGHVGVGHVHSHSGFVQDDSAGFAVAASFLQKATGIDLTIKTVAVDLTEKTITVTTKSGGSGTVSARRGITPVEKELSQRAVGQNAIFTQRTAVRTFGRIYGQGVLEVPVALQGACALAVLDSFSKSLGDKLLLVKENYSNKYDTFAGTVIEVDGIPISLMLVINGTNGGIGPDEDYEGNTSWTGKGKMMETLGLLSIPSAVIESKAFIPAMADSVNTNQFMVRAQKDVDCTTLGKALFAAGKENNIPIRFEDNLMPLKEGALKTATEEFADRVIKAAEELRSVDLSSDKTRLSAELAKLVSEDAGGVTFMSNSINDKVRGAGTLPVITAVLSMVTTSEYQKEILIPQVEEKDIENYMTVIFEGFKRM